MPRRRPVVRHAHVGTPHVLSSLLEMRGLLEMALLPASLPLLMDAECGGHFLAGSRWVVLLSPFVAAPFPLMNTSLLPPAMV